MEAKKFQHKVPSMPLEACHNDFWVAIFTCYDFVKLRVFSFINHRSPLTLVSRDRETTNDATPGPGIVSSTSNIRFRNQSPSASHRRSRERERIDRDTAKDHSLNQSLDMTVDHVETYHDETRNLEEMLGYPSLNSDELEYTDSDYKQMPAHLQSTPSTRHQRTNSLQAIDRLTTKIACTRECIRKEQTARDGEIRWVCHDFETLIQWHSFSRQR